MSDEVTESVATTEPAKTPDNSDAITSPEPAKTPDNQEKPSAPKAPSQEVKPYSWEELQSANNFTELEESRLPKVFADTIKSQKEAQAELTRIQQRLAAEEKKLPQETRPSEPRAAFAYDVIKAFDADDHTTVQQLMSSIDLAIEKRKMDIFDEIDPDKQAQIKQQVYEDLKFRNELQNTLSNLYSEKSLTTGLFSEIDTEIYKAMPKFNEVAAKLGDFLPTGLGIEKEVAGYLLNPKVIVAGLLKNGVPSNKARQVAKKTVVQLTKALYDIYMLKSGSSLKTKEGNIPPKVSAAGNSETQTTGEGQNLKALRDKAIKTRNTDDWAKYYSYKAERNL